VEFQGHVDDAIRKIKATLAWRKEFEVDKIMHCFDEDGDPEMRAIIEKENETGKIYCRGYDQEGRVAMYMRPHHENTHNALNNMRHLVYQLERAIACTEKKSGGLEKINLMVDYEHFRIRDSPPLSTSKWTITILQHHYPERLFKAYILNPGFVFRTFLSVVRPFLDPVTKSKLLMASGKAEKQKKIGERFDLDVLEESSGGEPGAVKDFDSKIYLAMPFDEAYA
jgi:CRAL/TRIO domain